VDVRAPEASGALVMSCDQPRLTAKHLRALFKSFSEQATPSIVASTYSGVQGVPAIFPRSVFSELRALRGDRGARSLLIEPPCPVIAVPFAGGELDIDLPADLAQLE
jgi:molybdenum cofactor cytidylyltransferase